MFFCVNVLAIMYFVVTGYTFKPLGRDKGIFVLAVKNITVGFSYHL